MKNWKTTLGGILSATVAGLLYTNKIDQTQSVYLLGAVGFIIGLFSKDSVSKIIKSSSMEDSKISDNTDPQNPNYPPRK